MRKFFLSIILITTTLFTFAQDSTNKFKIYHNEFGIDATGFAKQFLNFNPSTSGGSYYFPTYYLTYRRLFRCGNIRFAAGGDFANSESLPVPPDSNVSHSNSYSIDARLGWEFFSNIHKRFQIFYGVDFKPSYTYSKNDGSFSNGGYANGTENKTQIYGIAPLLGFRFKLTNRLSVTTEASYSINFSSYSGRRYFTPLSSQPPMPDVVTPKIKRIYSNFSQPVSVILTFNI
jgi:hypothetical protein